MDTLESLYPSNLYRDLPETLSCPDVLERIAELYPPDIKTRDRNSNWHLLYTTKKGKQFSIISVYIEELNGYGIFCKYNNFYRNVCTLMKLKDFKYTDENFTEEVYEFLTKNILTETSLN
jgi:hypothetical protein